MGVPLDTVVAAVASAEKVATVKIAIYLRVSTDDRGQTVENQRLPLHEFCRAQGWSEVVEYADEASANDLRGRREWRRLLDCY